MTEGGHDGKRELYDKAIKSEFKCTSDLDLPCPQMKGRWREITSLQSSVCSAVPKPIRNGKDYYFNVQQLLMRLMWEWISWHPLRISEEHRKASSRPRIYFEIKCYCFWFPRQPYCLFENVRDTRSPEGVVPIVYMC